MFFTVVIPTCHRNDDLAKCLESLAPGMQIKGFLAASNLQQSSEQHIGDASFLYEVVVSDDGRDSTAEAMIKARFPWARWVLGPRRGPAANRNNGAKYSQGEWLVFFDDDCVPDSKVLISYFTSANQCSESSVLEGRIFVDRPRLRMDEVAPLNESGGKLWSCNFSVNRKIFFSVGGFNESFPFACLEDTDMRYKLEASGADLVFVPDAAVMHPWRRFRLSILRYCKIRRVSYSILVSRWPDHHKPLGKRLVIIVKYIQLFIEDSIRFRMRGAAGGIQKLLGDILFLSFYSNLPRL